jgi:hypothetical protein
MRFGKRYTVHSASSREIRKSRSGPGNVIQPEYHGNHKYQPQGGYYTGTDKAANWCGPFG